MFFFQFLDSWKTLCDWMNEVEGRLLHKVMIGQSARTKQDLDELKVCFHAKNPSDRSCYFYKYNYLLLELYM